MDIFGINIDLASLMSSIVPVVLQIGLMILAFIILVPIGKKIIEKTLRKAGSNQKLSPSRVKTLEKLLLNVFSYVMFFVLILMLFGVLGIPLGPLLAGAGIIGLAIGFGAQGLVSDIVTGFFILLERQLEIDDYATTAGYDGIVEEIGLRTTKIRSFDGTLNYVPNRYIEGVANHTRGNMRALVDISIQHNDNIDKAITVLEEVCEGFKEDERFKEGPDAIGVQSFGSTDIVLRVVGQTENGLQWECERAMRKSIKEAFNHAGIETPFPQQVAVQMKQ
ncbi:mechanosensitive ion channel family protein [Lentibacillus amyloliquefaciens]|uniref:Mechanosensitive ion channel protein n=1 Tax=Lentibacillus amyloliquefaciens TaxID=1472767 RepID=A0A0U4FF71_9BACI|nr:mechanosensitive ion channel family protein [Lentibacillus amyloliquefaciens]ALX47326.1 mechanosensitive ion channel protein [Lentibacillus amyloliquefaciens]